MSTKVTEKFFGPRKVISVSKEDYKTPSGIEVLKVMFADGEYEIITQKGYDAFSTDHSIDYTALAKLKNEVMSRELIAVLLDYNFTNMELSMIIVALKEKIDAVFDRAINFLFFKDDKTWVAGSNSNGYFDLVTANKIIESIKPNGSTKEKSTDKSS